MSPASTSPDQASADSAAASFPACCTISSAGAGRFLALAGLSLAGAVVVALLLPKETGFVRSQGLGASVRQMLRHLKNPQLLATYAIGFGVLFNFIAVFTYVSFHLAAPPYDFSSTLLGAIFVTYLVGTVIAPMTGWMVARLGRRWFILSVIAAWALGALLMLAPPVPLIIAGLILCAACGMLCQTIATGYVTSIAKEGRSSAVGLYVTSFYIGGSMGAFLPGLAWNARRMDGLRRHGRRDARDHGVDRGPRLSRRTSRPTCHCRLDPASIPGFARFPGHGGVKRRIDGLRPRLKGTQ